jgi:aarF domain-containing kinase
MKAELADECDYSREASFMRLFGTAQYLGADPRYRVPWVWEGSTDKVLVMEYVEGRSVGEADIGGISQQDRNDVSLDITLEAIASDVLMGNKLRSQGG